MSETKPIITEIHTATILGGQIRITWKSDGWPCEFVTGLQLSYGQIEDWICGLDRKDMKEMYAGLHMITSGYLADPNLFMEFNFNG